MITEAARKYIYPDYEEEGIVLLHGDCREILPLLDPESIQCCVTSPPYWGLRDYGVGGQLGLEDSPEAYTGHMTDVFGAVKAALRPDGTLWLNLGDSYYNYRPGGGALNAQTVANGNIRSQPQDCQRRETKIDGLKEKDLVGIPWRTAFALQQPDLKCNGCGNVNHQSRWGRFPNGRWICPVCEKSKGHEENAGWYLRSDIIWSKPNPMPESVKDRPTKAHEYIFMMSRSDKYYYDHEASKERCSEENIRDFQRRKTLDNKGKGAGTYDEARPDLTRSRTEYMPKDFRRNRRSVWTVTTKPFTGAHFAVFPPELIEPCILAGTKEGDIVLDPFSGSGTTGMVCKRLKRRYIGIELNEEYLKISPERIGAQEVLF
jgi:DNA modification methylase